MKSTAAARHRARRHAHRLGILRRTRSLPIPMVGGAPMLPTKNIVENAMNSKDHTTLVAAVKAAGLIQTLEGKGPFTVFAPTNEAFAALPAGTVDTLLKPENKAKLVKILECHVVAAKALSTDVMAMVKADMARHLRRRPPSAAAS